jgi:hypothetical protein
VTRVEMSLTITGSRRAIWLWGNICPPDLRSQVGCRWEGLHAYHLWGGLSSIQNLEFGW